MIVLVDGPSGSGKTTLATRLGTLLRLPVIHMDDFYPGWSGLAAGSDIIATSVLKTTDPGFNRAGSGRGVGAGPAGCEDHRGRGRSHRRNAAGRVDKRSPGGGDHAHRRNHNPPPAGHAARPLL